MLTACYSLLTAIATGLIEGERRSRVCKPAPASTEPLHQQDSYSASPGPHMETGYHRCDPETQCAGPPRCGQALAPVSHCPSYWHIAPLPCGRSVETKAKGASPDRKVMCWCCTIGGLLQTKDLVASCSQDVGLVVLGPPLPLGFTSSW